MHAFSASPNCWYRRVCTFLTGYDGEKIVEFGNGDMGKIQRLCSHLDRLVSSIDLSVAKRQRRAMGLATYRMREKFQSHIKDLHNKVPWFLVKEYKVIFLPTFLTSEMVVKSGRKLTAVFMSVDHNRDVVCKLPKSF